MNEKKKELAIVLGATGNMAFALGNVLIGLKKHNPELIADIIVFEQNISKNDKNIIDSIIQVKFVRYNFPIKGVLKKDTLKRFSELTFSRFECFKLLDEYKKVLWLDIDILIQKNIEPLLNECSTGISLASGDKNNADFSMEIERIPHYNAGILYLQDNLPNYRNLTDWCYQKTVEYAKHLNCADQGIINLMIKEHNLDVHWLQWRYNYNPGYGLPANNVVIYHTFTPNKFWNYWDFPEWNKNNDEWLKMGGTPYRASVPNPLKRIKDFLRCVFKKNKKFPTLLVSSVIRSVQKNESHGGLYLVDLETKFFKQVIDWNNSDIEWDGRGGERGLRGIAFYKNKIYLASSHNIYVYDKQFNKLNCLSNKYLKYCHEIFIHRDSLFITSTGYDSIIEFDLKKQIFKKGYHVSLINSFYSLEIFNPLSNDGPEPKNTLHINNVGIYKNKIHFSGTLMEEICLIKDEKIVIYEKIPTGTHNVTPFKKGILFNHTAIGCIIYMLKNGKVKAEFKIKEYDIKELNNTNIPEDFARQGFGRGLSMDNKFIYGGSSPATVSVYDLKKKKMIKAVNISKDIRNAIHGLEIWPYDN